MSEMGGAYGDGVVEAAWEGRIVGGGEMKAVLALGESL